MDLLGAASGVDRMYVLQNQDSSVKDVFLRCRYEWARSGIGQSEKAEIRNGVPPMPRWKSALTSGKPIKGTLGDLPPSERAFLEAHGFSSILLAPISIDGSLWGAIGFVECREERDWSLGDLSTLMAASASIGGALARRRVEAELKVVKASLEKEVAKRTTEISKLNADLMREISERIRAEKEIKKNASRLETLSEISQALAKVELDYQRVLSVVSRKAAEAVGDASVVTLLSEDGRVIKPVAFYHADPNRRRLMAKLMGPIPLDADEGIGRVITTGRPLRISSIPPDDPPDPMREESRPYHHSEGVSSLLIVPLRNQNRIIGTLGIARDTPGRPYDDLDQRFVEELADRAAMAISNASLFESLQRELRERKRAEEALVLARDRFQALINASPLAIYSLDRRGSVSSWNPAAERIFDWKEDEVLGKVLPIVPEDDMERFSDLLDGVLNGNVFTGMKLERIRKNGTPVEVCLFSAPLRNSRGDVEGVMSLVEDVSERRRLVEKILFQASLLDQVKNAVIATSTSGEILYLNRSAEILFFTEAKEVLGKSIFDAMSAEETGKAAREVIATLRELGHYEGEVVVRRDDGSRVPHYLVGSSIPGGGGEIRGYVMVCVDITRLNKLEEDLTSSYFRLEDAYAELKNYDEARSYFIHTVSHELGTPLTVINSYIEMFQEGMLGELDPVQKEKIGIISTQTDLIIRLVQDMLDTSRIEARCFAIEIGAARVQDIARAAGEEVARLASRKDHHLHLIIDDDLPKVPGDAQRLKQVFENLLNNAIKFTPAGGEIVVRVSDGIDEIEVTVSDNGPGIPEEEQERIFEKYYTHPRGGTKDSSANIGLGLSIAKAIVEAHGGRIGVKSKPGRGSTFFFYLPKRPAELPRAGMPGARSMPG